LQAFFSIASIAYHNRNILPLAITSAGKSIKPKFMKTRPNAVGTEEVNSTTVAQSLVVSTSTTVVIDKAGGENESQ